MDRISYLSLIYLLNCFSTNVCLWKCAQFPISFVNYKQRIDKKRILSSSSSCAAALHFKPPPPPLSHPQVYKITLVRKSLLGGVREATSARVLLASSCKSAVHRALSHVHSLTFAASLSKISPVVRAFISGASSAAAQLVIFSTPDACDKEFESVTGDQSPTPFN